MAILTFEQVSKNFGAVRAVDELSFAIPEGGIFGFLGANGAGKTTSLRMILDMVRPDSGRISLWGRPPSRDNAAQIGFLPEERGLYSRMKVIENLLFFGRLRGLSASDARVASNDILERFDLGDYRDRLVKALSKGNAQKVQLAATLLARPKLLLLDEPFSGLDPVAQSALEDILREAADAGATVIFSTHVMSQAEKLCQSLLMLARGKLLFSGSLAEALAVPPPGSTGNLHDLFLYLNDESRAA